MGHVREITASRFPCFILVTLLVVGCKPHTEVDSNPRVTGIGDIFFKSKMPNETSLWYAENLGIKMDDNLGSPFEF